MCVWNVCSLMIWSGRWRPSSKSFRGWFYVFVECIVLANRILLLGHIVRLLDGVSGSRGCGRCGSGGRCSSCGRLIFWSKYFSRCLRGANFQKAARRPRNSQNLPVLRCRSFLSLMYHYCMSNTCRAVYKSWYSGNHPAAVDSTSMVCVRPAKNHEYRNYLSLRI